MPPPAQEEMAAAISDATLAILPRCGHLAPLERADMVTRLLRDWWPA
jgi:pimeloyl-ACP methyl ester carboxylesterase